VFYLKVCDRWGLGYLTNHSLRPLPFLGDITAGPSEYWLLASSPASKVKNGNTHIVQQIHIRWQQYTRPTKSKKMDSCRELFNPLNAELNPICHLLALLRAHHISHVSWLRVKTMEILPLYSQCIFSLLMYVVNNKYIYLQKNLVVHYHDTRSTNNFHPPTTNLAKYQKRGLLYRN